MILPDDMLVPITQDVDSLAPVHPALAGLGFQPAAKLTILLAQVRKSPLTPHHWALCVPCGSVLVC